MKTRLNIIGMTWETSVNAEVEGDKITFNKKEFDEMMSVIAETHDAISGGFQIVEESQEEQIYLSWTCTNCKQPVTVDTHEETLGGSGTSNEVTDITCPCGQVNKFVTYQGANSALVSLRDEGKIVAA